MNCEGKKVRNVALVVGSRTSIRDMLSTRRCIMSPDVVGGVAGGGGGRGRRAGAAGAGAGASISPGSAKNWPWELMCTRRASVLTEMSWMSVRRSTRWRRSSCFEAAAARAISPTYWVFNFIIFFIFYIYLRTSSKGRKEIHKNFGCICAYIM